VSTDGRYFSDGRIFDMTSGQIVGVLPDPADMLLAWTPAGILYGAGHRAFLWSPGSSAPIEAPPGDYDRGTDVGIRNRDGCPVVVRLHTDGSDEELYRSCGASLMTVSPQGSWALTRELVAIDTSTGEQQPLAGRPVRTVGYAFDAHWLDEDTVLLSVPGGGYRPGAENATSDSAIIVRCHLDSGNCEKATEAIPHAGPNLVLSMP
jgi:hypothetical protein